MDTSPVDRRRWPAIASRALALGRMLALTLMPVTCLAASQPVPVAPGATAADARPAPPAGVAQDAAATLHALFDSAWEAELALDPDRATDLGDARYNGLWTSMSTDAIERRHRHDEATLAQLRRIPRAALAAPDQLNYDLFEREYLQRLATWPFKPWLYAIDHQGGIQTLHEVAERLPFQTVEDYEDWNRRLRAVGALVDEHIALLEIAARERRTQPRVIMERVRPQLAAQVVGRAEDSPFQAPFTRFPASIPAADRARLGGRRPRGDRRRRDPGLSSAAGAVHRRVTCRPRARRSASTTRPQGARLLSRAHPPTTPPSAR